MYEIDGEEVDDVGGDIGNLDEWESDVAALTGTSAGATLTIGESGGDIVYNVES